MPASSRSARVPALARRSSLFSPLFSPPEHHRRTRAVCLRGVTGAGRGLRHGGRRAQLAPRWSTSPFAPWTIGGPLPPAPAARRTRCWDSGARARTRTSLMCLGAALLLGRVSDVHHPPARRAAHSCEWRVPGRERGFPPPPLPTACARPATTWRRPADQRGTRSARNGPDTVGAVAGWRERISQGAVHHRAHSGPGPPASGPPVEHPRPTVTRRATPAGAGRDPQPSPALPTARRQTGAHT